MNPNNYTSLEMSRRLVDAGIVMETEKSWAGVNVPPSLVDTADESEGLIKIPSPSVAELIDAAPQGTSIYKDFNHYEVSRGVTWVTICSPNLTNALAKFLIWVKEREGE